jgi:hypothetical protein
MRHTCITLNRDAGVPRDLIRSITGHEVETIDEVLKCYAATTADQLRPRSASLGEIGAPEEIRTPNLLIRSQMLYPVELRARGRTP